MPQLVAEAWSDANMIIPDLVAGTGVYVRPGSRTHRDWKRQPCLPDQTDLLLEGLLTRMKAVSSDFALMSGHVRIGMDLIPVQNVLDSIRNFGPRYLERVYTAGEIAYCQRSASEMGLRLAARFAAKEAALKVLRPHRHWLDWRNIEIVKAPGGWCELQLHGPAELLRERSGILSLSVSLSHETDYAVAVVAATVRPAV